jgi:nitrogen-specific signal transduction histidine kinase
MNIYENWVEQDLNPILSFSSQGKILYTNQEAQFLLNRVKKEQLYDLALKHAPANYGFETSYINLTLHNYIFYAISVTYENDDEIHLKLYKSTSVKQDKKYAPKNVSKTNIFTLVDLTISTRKTKSEIKFIKNYDPSIPEFFMVASDFLKLLNSIYDAFNDKCKIINTSVKLKTGEYIKLDNRKHSLVTIEIYADNCSYNMEAIKHDKNRSSMILSLQEEKATIDVPLILK